MSRTGKSDPVTPHCCLAGSQSTSDLEVGVEGTLQVFKRMLWKTVYVLQSSLKQY